ncbi:hypothetical protein PTKIN_Ptkin09bG0005300 [Pterospermum kingtungense]
MWVLWNSKLFPETTARELLSCRSGKLLIVEVTKNNNNDNKQDTHSFIPKPEETTGFFPEAVLLKEKKVQADGRLLPEFADDEERNRLVLISQPLNVERMRHYEVVYLVHEKHDDEVDSVNEKVQDKDERVVRPLVMKRDDAITEDCPPPPEWHAVHVGGDDEEEDDVYEVEDDEDLGEDEVDIFEDGIISGDDDDYMEDSNSESASVGNTTTRRNLKAEKVASAR